MRMSPESEEGVISASQTSQSPSITPPLCSPKVTTIVIPDDPRKGS